MVIKENPYSSGIQLLFLSSIWEYNFFLHQDILLNNVLLQIPVDYYKLHVMCGLHRGGVDNISLLVFARNGHYVVYSVRELIRMFLDIVSNFGDRYGEELMRLVNDWVNSSRNSQFLIKYINQLISSKGEIMKIIKKFNLYTLHFSPYRVFRL